MRARPQNKHTSRRRGGPAGARRVVVMESQAQQKLERKLGKVEKKRFTVQVLSTMQLLLGPPYAAWTLWVTPTSAQRSALASVVGSSGLLWALAGALGLYAVTRRRVQSLVIFTSVEIFLVIFTSCSTSLLLLLHHLHCWAPAALAAPAAPAAPALAGAYQDPRSPALRCPNVAYLVLASAAMVIFLAATASEALSLRLRIQKTGAGRCHDLNARPRAGARRVAQPPLATAPNACCARASRRSHPQSPTRMRLGLLSRHTAGKRNLNWNMKAQRWKERNVRRGASAALRALAPQLKDGDSRADEDSRIKYLASRGAPGQAALSPPSHRPLTALSPPSPRPLPALSPPSPGLTHPVLPPCPCPCPYPCPYPCPCPCHCPYPSPLTWTSQPLPHPSSAPPSECCAPCGTPLAR